MTGHLHDVSKQYSGAVLVIFIKVQLTLLCLNHWSIVQDHLRGKFKNIVERSLPLRKVISYYKQCPGAAKQVILDYVTFYEERKKVS